jgi:hypothetical protein
LADFEILDPIRGQQDPLDVGSALAKSLSAHRITKMQNKHRETSMFRVGFEPTTSVFERKKTVLASDRAAAMNDLIMECPTFKAPGNSLPFSKGQVGTCDGSGELSPHIHTQLYYISF